LIQKKKKCTVLEEGSFKERVGNQQCQVLQLSRKGEKNEASIGFDNWKIYLSKSRSRVRGQQKPDPKEKGKWKLRMLRQ
jgi:hypothetical protein